MRSRATNTRRPSCRVHRSLALGVVGALIALGCSGDDQDAVRSTTTASSSAPTASSDGSSAGDPKCEPGQPQVPGDPYSPPCASPAQPSGSDENVRVVVLVSAAIQANHDQLAGPESLSIEDTAIAYAEYLTEAFELHGRALEVVTVNDNGDTDSTAREVADAGAFAAINVIDFDLAVALAENEQISVTVPSVAADDAYVALAPFAWGLGEVPTATQPVSATSTIAYEAFKTTRPTDEPSPTLELLYSQLQLITIGVQGADGSLTAETFEQSLFESPEADGSYGTWQFGPDDRTASEL